MTNKVKQSRSELHGSKKKKWGLGRWFLIIFFLVLLAGAAHAVRILWKIRLRRYGQKRLLLKPAIRLIFFY